MTRGFTLAEIVVVLALLGIMAAVAVPAFTRLDAEDDATRAAGDVVRVLHAARRTALERAVTASVVVDPTDGRYWVSLGDAAADGDSGTLALPAGVTLLGPEPRARFVFQPNGTVVGDSLVLRGPARTALVTVDRWTGDVLATAR
jgi:prepilin-type N-terminal cleavage/methylation domain-containing protein